MTNVRIIFKISNFFVMIFLAKFNDMMYVIVRQWNAGVQNL